MEYRSTLIVVQDLAPAKRFYCELMGMHVTADFGASVTLDDAVVLQTAESWRRIVGRDLPAARESNSGELYFETEHFDAFLERLAAVPAVKLVHPPLEHPWGQRVIRLYDPDGHIVEVGEDMKMVAERFLDSGLTVAETARRMDVPEAWIRQRTGRY